MNLIEIIDDDFELDLFKTVNGSNKVRTNSSKEYDYLINKAITYINKYGPESTKAFSIEGSSHRKTNNIIQENLIKQYDRLNSAVQ